MNVCGAPSKLSSTITSVPPWIGTASGRSAFRRSASSSERGASTSTSASYRGAMADLARRLAVARGDEPADLVVRGGRVLSVFTREWLDADVAIVDGWIAGLGRDEGRDELDAGGGRVVPRVLHAPHALQYSQALRGQVRRVVPPLGP